MKILLAPLGSHGDVHPFVGLGLELARRGHRVLVITNALFRDLAERVGLTFVEMGTEEEFQRAINDLDLWHPIKGIQVMFRYLGGEPVRLLYEKVMEHYEAGKTVVVHSPLGFGARIAQEKWGVALATVHLAPSSLRSIVRPSVLPGVVLPPWSPYWYRRLVYWLGDRFVFHRTLAGPLNAFRAKLGLRPVSGQLADWWNSPQRILGLFPDWFAPPPPDWPEQTRLTGFPLYDEQGVREVPSELEHFLQAGEPPIVVTPGSAMAHGREFFRAALEACRRLRRRGILLTRFAEHLPGNLPDSVRHYSYVPFSQVLPRAAALVHHGGIGTTAQGLAAAVPQVIMPMGFDQPDNAARVARLGAGAVLMPKHFTGVNLARQLQGVLTPGVQASCRDIAVRLRKRGAVAQVCDLIEALADDRVAESR